MHFSFLLSRHSLSQGPPSSAPHLFHAVVVVSSSRFSRQFGVYVLKHFLHTCCLLLEKFLQEVLGVSQACYEFDFLRQESASYGGLFLSLSLFPSKDKCLKVK